LNPKTANFALSNESELLSIHQSNGARQTQLVTFSSDRLENVSLASCYCHISSIICVLKHRSDFPAYTADIQTLFEHALHSGYIYAKKIFSHMKYSKIT
jgi:hypothetical protein